MVISFYAINVKRRFNLLLLGDCNDHLKDINDNSIDLLLTDPPYFLINTYIIHREIRL